MRASIRQVRPPRHVEMFGLTTISFSTLAILRWMGWSLTNMEARIGRGRKTYTHGQLATVRIRDGSGDAGTVVLPGIGGLPYWGW